MSAVYSALAPESLTTLAHFTISVAWYLASSSGDERTASSPNVLIRSATSGSLKTRNTSAFNLSITGLGVLAGANMANQVVASKPGNQNLSAFGPLQHPSRQMFGVRGAPGNTINHATSYWVGNHSKRVFCDAVDIVSGIGWDRVDPGNPAFRFTNVYRVVSNLGVFDFGGPGHTMRAVSLHPGVDPDEVASNTSFEVHDLDTAVRTRLATVDELALIRERIDPKALRDKEVTLPQENRGKS